MNALTPNQIVARNLRALREELGISQEEAARRVEPHLGTTWAQKKSMWSAIERSDDPQNERARRFTVDDLVAFSLAFERPPVWFLLPAADTEQIRPTRESADTLEPSELLDALFLNWEHIDNRLADLPKSHRGEALRAMTELMDEYMRQALKELDVINADLDGIAVLAGDLRLRFGDAQAKVRTRLAEERRRIREEQSNPKEEK